jgi:hypothetical protein
MYPGFLSGTSRTGPAPIDASAAAGPTYPRPTVLVWEPGDPIHMGRRTLQVVRLRDDDADQAPVLVVQDVAERALAPEPERGQNQGEVSGGVASAMAFGSPPDSSRQKPCDLPGVSESRRAQSEPHG